MSCGVYAPRVLSSERLRAWLEPMLRDGKQEDWADRLGLAQPTISRLLNQDTYDVPLDTVARIAAALKYTELSEFLRHVEQGMEPAEHAAIAGGPPRVDREVSRPSKAPTADELIRLGDAFYAAAEAARVAASTRSTRRARARGAKASKRRAENG